MDQAREEEKAKTRVKAWVALQAKARPRVAHVQVSLTDLVKE